jgi:RimJ/RimL family protein N-acetyltransferase
VLFRSIRSNFKSFLSLLVDQDSAGTLYAKGIFWRIDTSDEALVGVFYLTDLELGVNAIVHFSFLDGRIKGRVPLAKAMLKKVFDDFPIERVTAELPAYVNKRALEFVQELGFKKEGVKRKATKFDNALFHVHLFGLLREEMHSDGNEN